MKSRGILRIADSSFGLGLPNPKDPDRNIVAFRYGLTVPLEDSLIVTGESPQERLLDLFVFGALF